MIKSIRKVMVNLMTTFKQNFPGLMLCFPLALLAWFLGGFFPIVGGAVFGIVLGMAIAAAWKRPAAMDCGIKFTSKKILQYAIILLGFEMNMGHVLRVGSQSLFVMLFTLSGAFLTAFWVSRLLKIDNTTSILIGVGTSICGGSAIAATAPVINAPEEKIAQSISTIFLFNIIAVFLFPPLGQLLGLSDLGFGMWAGTAINDTSSVVAAGSAWSQRVGNDLALNFATIVKLTRTLMIVPITLVLAIHTSKKAQNQNTNYSFVKVFPWFVLGFIGAALINTFLPIPQATSTGLATLGKFLIVMAMTAIGLNTNLKKLLTSGFRPLCMGLSCWFAVASISLLVQMFTSNL